MDNSTYVALSLAQSMRRDLDVTSNNIATANTAGFKGEHLVFESYLHKGGQAADDEQISFVADSGSYTDDSQGPMSQTGNSLDIALLGKGWISYRTEDNKLAYGRDGRLALDPNGTLVTLTGAKVLDESGGEISIPPDAGEIEIARDGTISSATSGPIARIGVFDLPDLQVLERMGNGMLTRPEGSPASIAVAATGTEVVQGAIEGSNVQPVTEMTRLMEIQRSYERAINLMNGGDELRRDTLQRLGRLG